MPLHPLLLGSSPPSSDMTPRPAPEAWPLVVVREEVEFAFLEGDWPIVSYQERDTVLVMTKC